MVGLSSTNQGPGVPLNPLIFLSPIVSKVPGALAGLCCASIVSERNIIAEVIDRSRLSSRLRSRGRSRGGLRASLSRRYGFDPVSALVLVDRKRVPVTVFGDVPHAQLKHHGPVANLRQAHVAGPRFAALFHCLEQSAASVGSDSC